MTTRRLVRVAAAASLAVATSAVATASPATAEVACDETGRRYVDEASDNLVRLAVGRAWQLSTGAGVTVAVVDSGVAADNAHLRENVRRGRSFVPGDADPSGRTDLWGHGTAVAGLVAARYVEGSALFGLAPDAQILPVRVFVAEQTESGLPLPADQVPDVGRMAQGIAWAAENGADVINVSMSTRKDLPALRSAVRRAVRNDIVVVASGGNRGEDDVDGPRFPAAYPGVIGVAASDPQGAVTDASIHGPHIDVHAPGQEVLAPYKSGGDCLVGLDKPHSSYAAAYVSGLAALLRAEYPDESAAEIAYRITAGANRPLRGSRDDLRGWGMIQPLEALSLTLDPGRPGPALPGGPRQTIRPAAADLPPIRAQGDPLADVREQVLWWLLLGSGAVGLALVLRPLTLAARRRPVRVADRKVEGPR